MPEISSLLAPYPYIDLPHELIGWIGLIVMALALCIGISRSWRGFPFKNSQQWLIGTILLLSVPLTSLLFSVSMPGEQYSPIPNVPVEVGAPLILLFSALPWVLAGGFLGPFPAVVLGVINGFLLAFWGTHSLFTPVEIGGLALLYSLAVRQNYRTRLFRVMRHPVGAVAVLVLAYIPVFLLSSFFSTNGTLAVRLDYALTQSWTRVLARVIELGIAGLIAEVLYLLRLKPGYFPQVLRPAPQETSLQARFFMGAIPLMLVFLIGLTVGDWLMAGNAARQMLEGRMSSTALVAAESLPYFMESGQNLIASAAQPDLLNLSREEMKLRLAENVRTVPYFRQLFVFDAANQPRGGHPVSNLEELRLEPEEENGISLAYKGVAVQTYTIPPFPGEKTAQISFIAAIRDENGQTIGVLLGRTDLQSNPFTQPALRALDSIQQEGEGAAGLILDENQVVLYDTVPDSTLVMSQYTGVIKQEARLFDEVSSTGTRQLVYYQPVQGRPWTIVISLPAEIGQQLALDIALPLLAILLFFAGLAIIPLSLALSSITRYLQTLSGQATLISRGQLDSRLAIQGEDEVGRLARAFEVMRLSLKARLEELNQLLTVSQGVAANLEIEQAVRPILEAALGRDATLARLVFIPEVRIDLMSVSPVSVGAGPASERYSHLDAQIYNLMRGERLMTIPNLARVRRLNIPAGRPQPAALIALALHYENAYYGTLWVAYDSPRSFTEEQVRFLSTLAGEAAMAAANARLYAGAEIGRQRMSAVLASTPDPVLVVDEQDRILLLNPAAMQVANLVAADALGKSVGEAILAPELRQLLTGHIDGRNPAGEVPLSNGKVFYSSVSAVMAEGHPVGKVCILRDITHFKELDALKSDFVATVSHDLRSPLTLMKGYATMIQHVGELNEQQKAYLAKILTGVENMSQLVSNLLDLGRIEAGIGLRLEHVSPVEVAETAVQSLQPVASQKSIQLSLETDAQTSDTIEADAALLRQAVLNLLENAVKYTRSGQVKVRVTKRPDSVLFEVMDTGIGIAPLDLPRVFEKFYRSGLREAYQQRGTGLGLAIVRSIADRHAGKVWVESQLGKGSCFFLEVPVRPEMRPAP